ncbi:flavin reductase family protein [Nonomuraea thailandensis]
MALFDEAIATVECATTAVHDGGDHSIVVGAVTALGTPADGAPLLYHEGRYKSL